MTFRITQSVSTLALAIALIAGPLSAQEPSQTAAPNTEASTPAFRCYDLGTFTFCVSVHGNIVSVKAPKAGPEDIGIVPVREGYVVCATMSNGFTQVSYDAANAESGFIGSPTIIEPIPFNLPLTVIRTTVSNLKVTQVFTANAADREVLITTTIQNPNFDSRYVRFDRYFDGDLAGTAGGDIYSRSVDAVWGQEGLHAFVLSDANFPAVPHTTSVQNSSVFNPADCGQATVPTPTLPGDFVGRLTYDLNVIPGTALIPNGGGTRTFRIKYRKL